MCSSASATTRTESNGHLSEYLPWYRKRTDEIGKWIDLSSWINGETGGYLRVCTEGRNWFETDFPNWLKEQPPKIGPAIAAKSTARYIIEALETGRTYRGHFNVINRGHITESAGRLRHRDPRLRRPHRHQHAGRRRSAAGLRRHVHRHRARAADGVGGRRHGDVTLLKQAMLHDPLVGAVCDPEEVWQMTDEMLVPQAQWLPQYKKEIAAAKKRLADAEKSGTRVKLVQTQGCPAQDQDHCRDEGQCRRGPVERGRRGQGQHDQGNGRRQG